MSVHNVQPGDTLTKLAQRYNTSVQELARVNNIDLHRPFNLPAQLKLPTPALEKSSFRSAPSNTLNLSGTSSPAVAGAQDIGAGGKGVGAAVLNSAKAQLGVKQDCTALVENALKAAGVKNVGDESPASLRNFGTRVTDPQPGDIIYYDDAGAGFPHVAIYAGKDKNGTPMAVHGGFNGNTELQPVNLGSGPVSYHRPNA